MNKGNVKVIAMNAMIACVYAVLTIACSAIAYGGIQFRISEILIFLVFYNKKYIPGLVAGCLLANLPSPLGLADVCFGTLATLIACIGMYKIKNLYLAALFGALVNGLIVGTELYYVLNLPFVINAFYVFIGEFAVLIIGSFMFKKIEKNSLFMKKYILDL